MKRENGNFAWIFVIIAGILWGAMGLFVDDIASFGFSERQTAFLRVTTAALLFVIFALVRDRKALVFRLRDLPVFLGLGVCSILAMSCFYFLAIRATSYSVAAILLYTAPVIVSAASVFLFGETFTPRKTAALMLAVAGCVCVSGIFGSAGRVTPIGFLFGLASGVSYALYSIFGKIALKKGYKPLTVSTYAFVFASAGALFVCDVPAAVGIFVRQVQVSPVLILHVLLLGFFTAFLPYLSYTFGLSRTEAGRAAIMASVEPLAATLIGLMRGQPIGFFGAVGVLLVLLALLFLKEKQAKELNRTFLERKVGKRT